MFGLTIGNKHTYNDFDLIMTKYYIPEPEVKRNVIDLPFASGSIDITDATGETPYADRDGLEFEFVKKDGDYSGWDSIVQDLAMHLHGKSLHMISDNDTAYYYVVRLQVDWNKSNKHWGTIVLSGTAEPFKYSIVASNEPWIWDTFNFVNGIINSTSDLVINGGRTVVLSAGGILTPPTFTVTQTNGLGIRYGSKILQMNRNGKYKFPQIKVGESAYTIEFVGSGRVSIEYRGRYL